MAFRHLDRPGPPPRPGVGTLDLAGSLRLAAQARELSVPERLRAALDCARLTARRGIVPEEYFLQYRFHALTKEEQERFITHLEAQRITWRLSREIRDLFWHKDRFLAAFEPFLKRSWLWIQEGNEEAFRALCAGKDRLIVKPRASTGGSGVRALGKGELADPDGLFRRLLREDCVAEEALRNEPEMEAFHPPSLNTLRIVTLYNGTRFEVFGAAARFGRGGSAVDNVSSGGVYAAVDPETGRFISGGTDARGRRYEAHPDTGVPFMDFRVPRWEEVLHTVRTAADVLPHIRVAGWDAAVLRDGGVALVEGNHMPDFDLLQQPLCRGAKRAFEVKVQEMFGEWFLPGPTGERAARTARRRRRKG